MACPNKSTKEWKDLVKAVGENRAYYLWDINEHGLDKNPDGSESELYKETVDSITKGYNNYFSKHELEEFNIDALKIVSNAYDIDFLDNYGNWINDKDIEKPTFKDIQEYREHSTRDNGSLQTNIDRLQKVFEDLGIHIKVKRDDTLSSNGVALEEEGKKVIKYSPKATRRTIYHEFGHILIDAISDEEFIEEGFKQVRNTELYNKVKKAYPELSDDMLDKEVLTTAIAIESEEIENGKESSIGNRFRLWVKLMWNRLLELLKLKDVNVAQKLARQLVNGKVRYQVSRDFKLVEQHEKDMMKLGTLTKLIDTIVERKNDNNQIFNALRRKTKNADLVPELESIVEITMSGIEDVIKTGNLIDFNEVIQKNYDYDLKQLVNIEKHFNTLYNDYIVKNIKVSEVSNVQRLEFIYAVHGGMLFIESLAKVNNLQELKPDEGKELTKDELEINKTINEYRTDIVKRVQDLRNLLEVLNHKNSEYIMDRSTDPAYKGNLASILNNMVDITKMQLLFDAVGDMDNKFGALFSKLYRTRLDTALQDIYEKKKEYSIKYKAITKNMSNKQKKEFHNRIIKSDKLLPKYDIEGWWKEYHRITEELYPPVDKKIMTAKEYTEVNNKRWVQINKWVDANLEKKLTSKQIKDIIDKKEKELTRYEFVKWYDRNVRTYMSKDLEITYYNANYTSELRPVNDKWINSEYEALSSEEKEFLDYAKNLMVEMVDHISDTMQEEGALPFVGRSSFWKFLEQDKEDNQVEIDVLGEKVFDVPFAFIHMLNQKPIVYYSPKLDMEGKLEYEDRVINELKAEGYKFETFEELLKHNEQIKDDNKKAHLEALNNNLEETIPKFIESAMIHKAKQDVELHLKTAIEEIKHAKFIRKNGFFKEMFSKSRIDKDNNLEVATIEGIESNLLKRLRLDMEMNFYGRFTQPAKYNRLLKIIKQYNSLKGIAFNPFSGTKNIEYGTIQSVIESATGIFFNIEDVGWAMKTYSSGIISYLADTMRKDESASSIPNGLIKFFNIMESQDELLEKPGGTEATAVWGRRILYDAGYFLQHSGEHMMQNSILLSMLHSYRIIKDNEGKVKIRSFEEYVRDKRILVENVHDKKKAWEDIELNKKIEKDAKEKYEQYPRLIDAFSLDNDGYIVMNKEMGITKDELSEFKGVVRSVNHWIHGIYNPSDRGTIENKMYGQLLMQFRLWMRPGWTKRFGTRNYAFYNERRRNYDIGDYKSLVKLVTMPFNKKNRQHYLKDEYNVIQAVGAFLKSYAHFFTNARIYWHTMSSYEKAGVKRVGLELASVMTVAIMLYMLRKIDFDDDDDKKNWFYNMALYKLDAIKVELNTYTPVWGWATEVPKMMANPAATWGTFQGLVKLSADILHYPMELINVSDEEGRYFKGGQYNDQLKLKVHGQKLIPAIGQLERVINIADNNRYYRMFDITW